MSLHQQPDTTHIHRLTVRGPRGTLSSLQSRLQAGNWPAPSDGSWVLVREVHATASTNYLADELMERTQRLINKGDPSDVVRFPCLAALLAALIGDICKGLAQDRWYWQRWSRFWQMAPGDAAQRLIQEHPQQLAAICHQLAVEGNLLTLWQKLSPANALEIFYSFAHELNVSPNRFSKIISTATTGEFELKISSAGGKRWQSVFATWPHTDSRARLAALILASEYTSLALQTAPNETLDEILQRWVPISTSTKAPVSEPNHENRAFRPAVATPNRNTDAPEQSINVDHEHSTPKLIRSATVFLHPAKPLANPAGRIIDGEAKNPSVNHSDIPVSVAEQNSSQGIETNRVFTKMGGVLYLLNVLNRPPIQALIEKAWQIAPNGWYWLYQLGCELDLDSGDALCEFLAERLGLDTVTALGALPPLPYREEILSLTAQWLSPEDLWVPSLIRAPAEFSYTPGHFDLYLDNSQVRLELRLAGLDFNPGWLPWLGTVVTFHFDDFPHLQGAVN